MAKGHPFMRVDKETVVGMLRAIGSRDPDVLRARTKDLTRTLLLQEGAGNTFDSKFTLQPGEFGDARVEFSWQETAGQIYGTTFEIDLAIREIDPVGSQQYRLGREHVIHFSGFPKSGAAATTDSPAAEIPAAAPTHLVDPCAGESRCNFAGPFAAEVIRVNKTVTPPYNDNTLAVTIRFSNLTAEHLILGYKSGSSGMVDDAGNRYYWGRAGTHDGSARGIGLVTGSAADPSFQIAPGKISRCNLQGVVPCGPPSGGHELRL
jgi:hypothetical protein